MASSRLHAQTLPLFQNVFCFEQSRPVNNLLKKIFASGIVSKFKHDLKLDRKMPTELIEIYIVKLTYSTGIILILFIIGTLIVIALILEFVIYHKAHSINATKFWKFMDKLICGHRCFFLLEK